MGFLADFKRMAESGNYKKNKDSLLDSPLVTINVDGQPMEGRNQSFSKGGKFWFQGLLCDGGNVGE